MGSGGHSWAPTPLKGSRVNVGTTSPVPGITAGKTCCRSMLAKWGGGSVLCAGQSPDQVGSSPSDALVRGVISKSGVMPHWPR